MNRDMNPLDPAFDPRIADWLEADPDRAPREVLDTVLAAMPSIPQRRSLRLPWRLPEMFDPYRAAAAAILGVLLIGGVFLIYQRAGPSDVGGVAVSPSPSPTVRPSASPSPTATSGTGACSLVTPDEAERQAGRVGLGALPTETGSGPATTCTYKTGGLDTILRIDLSKTGGNQEFDVVSAKPGVRSIAALGDGAVFDPATDTLTVRKGDALVVIVIRFIADTSDARLAIEQRIAEIALPRVTQTP
jgi:hypothetical protein